MKYCVIGSGGREHTIAWRLLNDGSASEVYVLPGNGGIEDRFRVDIPINDFPAIEKFCIEKDIDTIIVGPEAPLVEGIVDYFLEKNIPVFGPTKKAAMLEGSKLFAKMIMEKYGVPTAAHDDFTDKELLREHIQSRNDFPLVIKLDGLAAGKGVCVAMDKKEALDFIAENVAEGQKVFVEEFIDGEEASVLGISDGETILTFTAAQDHKRIFDGDTGPNTGGMGAYAPAPVMDAAKLERVYNEVLKPTIDGMRSEGIPFRGILYAGIITKGDDIKVLEFNVRFGDPEAQVILPLLNEKLGDIIQGSIQGTLGSMNITFREKHAITVVMASGGYPGSYDKGKVITGLDDVLDDVIVFHAGTKNDNGTILTSGGRVLNVTTVGDSLVDARERVYREIQKISFDGAFYRKDIAHRAL
ncbi:MAG TPA: phosphoribosylamine--glycine ligase [Spirochaetota bacterium]|nr:phosphoribosylamine--glycine ligase [Spirochaetota bacterium]HPQ52319.1 phosphoribosylamine--glycine ligase [Spirochaetota bacterium]